MTTEKPVDNRWTGIVTALLLGYVALNVLLHQAFVRGVGASDGAAQLMMWVAVVGVVSYAALRQELDAGYWLAFLTAILSVAFNGLIGSGVLGIVPTEASGVGFVLGPVAHVAYALVLFVATYLALRERRHVDDVPGATSESTVG
jgi:hypothetical protein